MKVHLRKQMATLLCLFFFQTAAFVPRALSDEAGDEPGGQVFIAPDPVPNTSLQTGALTKQIPIEVPPGRNGMEPKIALQYDSYNTKNGWLGVGWSLNIDFIQRSTKRGVDYSANDFVFGGNEFVAVSINAGTGAGEYRAKIENDFTRFFYSPSSGWTAQL